MIISKTLCLMGKTFNNFIIQCLILVLLSVVLQRMFKASFTPGHIQRQLLPSELCPPHLLYNVNVTMPYEVYTCKVHVHSSTVQIASYSIVVVVVLW